MNKTSDWMATTAALGLAVGMGALLMASGSNQAMAEGHGEMEAEPARSANWLPVESMHLYLCAFHVAKEHPDFAVEAHHYCAPQGGKLHQCVIYDSKGSDAKMLGVEYIISDEQYKKLDAAEKKYWHPHAYEILSGQLIAPDMPNMGDDIFPGLITTWGKTWHTWADPTTELPTGTPILMWSANGDGQLPKALIEKRDAQFGISTEQIRDRRKAMGYAVPNIPPPKSINDPGRIWTPSGADEPTKTK